MIYTDLINQENIKKEVKNYLDNLNRKYWIIFFIY